MVPTRSRAINGFPIPPLPLAPFALSSKRDSQVATELRLFELQLDAAIKTNPKWGLLILHPSFGPFMSF
jgi:hypothetical protein